MVEPIEHYFRGFGGRQTPYFCITKAGLRARSALAARNGAHGARAAGTPPCLGRPPLAGDRRVTVPLAGAAICASGLSPWACSPSRGHDRDADDLHGLTGLYGLARGHEDQGDARLVDPTPYASWG